MRWTHTSFPRCSKIGGESGKPKGAEERGRTPRGQAGSFNSFLHQTLTGSSPQSRAQEPARLLASKVTVVAAV